MYRDQGVLIFCFTDMDISGLKLRNMDFNRWKNTSRDVARAFCTGAVQRDFFLRRAACPIARLCVAA
jgi:hypothetical protein